MLIQLMLNTIIIETEIKARYITCVPNGLYRSGVDCRVRLQRKRLGLYTLIVKPHETEALVNKPFELVRKLAQYEWNFPLKLF